MSIDELKNIPDMKKNVKIWNEVQNGDLENIDEMTYLPVSIAEKLSKYNGNLWLTNLTSITDAAAEHLSRHKGVLGLDKVVLISEKAAEYLAKKEEDELFLNNGSIRNQINKYK
jgi:hypothetical protein